MRYPKLALVAVICLCIAGCAATGPLFSGLTTITADSSEIVVYRPDRFARGGVTYFLHVDGREVAALKNAGFVTIPASPGPHELEIRASALQPFRPMKVNIDTKPGARVFLRFEPYASGGAVFLPALTYIPVSYNLLEVTEAQALIDLKELKRSE
jgi:hypothetical protein